MELKDIFLKLDTLNEHISNLREITARMGAVIEENTRDVRNHIRRTELLEADVVKLRNQQSEWKGAILAASAIFGLIVTISQILLKVLL